MFLLVSLEAGGQRLITRYWSLGDLNSMDERPLSNITGLRLAVVVRGTLFAKKESITE